MTITEKNLAEKLAGIYGDINDYDWAAVARKAAEVLGVDLAPEPKPLPTEPGSVIIVTEVRGERGKWPMFVGDGGDWVSPASINGYIYHLPDHITAWTEARVVPVTTTPVTLTEDQVGELHEVERLKDPAGVGVARFNGLPKKVRAIHTATVNAALAQHAAPAEGELIDPDDVRKGDLVRMELDNGDEVTLTVIRVNESWFESRYHSYSWPNIRSVRLLHREEA